MTSLHKITLSKTVFIGALLLTSKIVPAESIEDELLTKPKANLGVAVDSTDEVPPPPPSDKSEKGAAGSVDVLPPPSNDENFEKLIKTLNSLKLSGKKINKQWSKAVTSYFDDSDLEMEKSTLQKLKQRILSEKFEKDRKEKIKNIFKVLLSKENSPAQELVFLVLGPEDLDAANSSNPFDEDAEAEVEAEKDDKANPSWAKIVSSPPKIAKLPTTPAIIREHLKISIAGQDLALGTLSSLAHRYMCNKSLIELKQKPAGRPPHCILTGPTGCGKSETLRQLGNFLQVPILHINARCLTDEGYKGFNFSEAVCNFSRVNKKPKCAIVAIDEIDKLDSNGGDGEKNFGLAIQRVLLSCLDGNPVCKDGDSYDISSWWFIGTGAFSGIKGIHDDEKEKRATTALTHDDIIKYGFEPEFVGRFQSIIPFKGHTLETMIDVITREGSPISLAKNEFKAFYSVELCFEEKALQLLAESSIKIGLGVRSLHTVLNEVLEPLHETASAGAISGSVTITEQEISPFIERMKKSCKMSKKDEPPFGMYM
jgi:ATP-dependent Clp protease ATP-binding subunit ClpX